MRKKGQSWCKVMDSTNFDIVTDTQVVVLMGGLGTRLGLKNLPKAMADVNGLPFFDYQLKLLKRWGFHKFLFLVGYQAECIEKYYQNGSKWQVDIQYSYDGPEQMGTGGALNKAAKKLEDDFLLIYGDSFMDIDYQEVVYRYRMERKSGKYGIMAILHNENKYDKSNVIFSDGRLYLYDKINTNDKMQYIDYGVSMLSKDIFSITSTETKFDVATLLSELSQKGLLSALEVTKRFYEIGTPDSLQEFALYAQKRFYEKSKAVFLDRDGVINELYFNDDTEQLDSPFTIENFVYKKNIIHTLLCIQEMGYLIFIVTNQPAAAKGKVPLSGLYNLNTWLNRDLKSKGIKIEFINICPHHPKGEQKTQAPFLIKQCNCRKPKAGLITSLLQVYNIDTAHSYMVGDSYTDMIAGKKAGLKTIFIGNFKCDICQRLQGNMPDKIIYNIDQLKDIIKEGK